MRSQAATEAQLALQRAQREADAIVANARSTARRIAEGAQAEADAIQKRAQREAQEVHDAAASALADARLRLEEIERIEASFEANAREIARWLGLTVEPERSVFAGIRRKK
jgi:cell division septum initiation protein DivIVA